MKEGFYSYRGNIYYGFYNEKQVSGWSKISIYTPEEIQTDHPFDQDEIAVCLWDNHSLLEPEYSDLQGMLLKMAFFTNINTEQQIDFSKIEEKLNIALPRELKQVYTAIYDQEEYFSNAERFLPLDELYVENGILVFFKKKRTAIAGYDIDSGCLAQYYKKEWNIDKSDMCCYQFCIGRIIIISLECKPVFRKGRCKGTFVTTLNIEKELAHFCNDKYHLLTEFNVYGIAVLYSDEKLIAWIRSNGFYGDIHAGAVRNEHLEALADHLGNIAWK